MSAESIQAEPHSSPARPGIVLALTFLLIGLSFALPLSLVPPTAQRAFSDRLSAETANVYALVAWAGWAHFLYAFRGQFTALSQNRDGMRSGRIGAYFVSLAAITGILLLARSFFGIAVFSGVVWMYFIDHFIKAEESFEGKRERTSMLSRWIASYQTLLTFGWLSLVLLNVADIDWNHWLIWTVSLALAVIVLACGGAKKLIAGEVRQPMLSLFFVAEALVWGAFSRYGGPVFLTGVYIFHIAAGSYFHYLGSYFMANTRSKARDFWLTPIGILLTNAVIAIIGFTVTRAPVLGWLSPVLGIEWFTVWVGLHLVASDLFPLIKTWKPAVKIGQEAV